MDLTKNVENGGNKKMSKIKMNKISQDELMGLVLSSLEVPQEVEIVDLVIGDFKTNTGEIRPWANFECVDTYELELLKSVGLEENASIIKFKIQDYEGESLQRYLNKKIDVSDTPKVFITDKNKNISGLAFRDTLENLKEV